MKSIRLFYLIFYLSANLCNCQQKNNQPTPTYDNSSFIASTGLTPSKIQDLVVFGKVWGFLKYYHPIVTKGKYNWDQELFRMLPKIAQSKTIENRNNVLLSWINELGKIETDSAPIRPRAVVKLNPDLNWIGTLALGDSLTKKLRYIQTAKRGSDHYYVDLVTGVDNPIFKNEEPYTNISYPDLKLRLLALYRYWNIIQYYYPNRNLTDVNWNDVPERFIPRFIEAKNELEYKLAVLSLFAHVHDSHINIWGKDSTLEHFKGEKIAPFEISFVEDKAVVTGYLDNDKRSKPALKKGDIIESVNGKSVNAIIEEKLPYAPASNYPTQLRNIAFDLLRTNDSVLSITYTRDKKTYTESIKCFFLQWFNVYSRYARNDTCFKLITPAIAYLYPGSIKNKYLAELMPHILKTKGLIIDLRCYPSDFIVFSLGEYLMPNPTAFVKFSKGNFQSPGLFTFTDTLRVGRVNPDYYKGKVVILINEITQSNAEYTTMAFRAAPNVVVIGSTTAGADGNVSKIYLPGGIMSMISGIGVYYPDGKETQRIGIIPDIIVKPTIKGILENRDEILEKAIELINK